MSKENEILETFDKIDFGFKEVDDGGVRSTIKTVDYPKNRSSQRLKNILEQL